MTISFSDAEPWTTPIGRAMTSDVLTHWESELHAFLASARCRLDHLPVASPQRQAFPEPRQAFPPEPSLDRLQQLKRRLAIQLNEQ